ncbi:Eco57I restriction-modification methylase domain-containing protein [Agilicoccus flavus]|uniref:Eco57I restriction-modification methylase domain-containing protein n=1 Tax=Agilicoccus flavus TaxID=2775968 RepID=UPI001CF60853|nr:SAM-dependent DNA methyltransferase [Agilicoccus flavus]
MSRRTTTPTRSVRDRHRAWLELVDTEGPFLALPVITRTLPQGVPPMEQDARLAMTAANPAFDRAWDAWDSAADKDAALPAYRTARDTWIDTVLHDVVGWGTRWVPGDPAAAVAASSPDHSVTVTATGVLRHKDTIGALVWVIDPVASLRDADDDGWSDTPIDRMEQMLRTAAVPIGLVTDGRWWAIVSAPEKTLAASGVVDAQTWVEEPEVRDAWAELLRIGRLVGKDPAERLSQLFADSVLAAEQITEALGAQVRKAVELVVAAFDESAAASRHRGDPDPLPESGDDIYAAVVTVIMRVVFLLFAEERGLLPTGELYAMGYGLSDQRERLEQRERDENAEALDATSLTWHRLLATSNALYGGATFEDLRLPAYGGSLFDPDRFPFLTATTERGTLALAVSDRVMLEVLRAVQIAVVDKEPRRISFRDIDVEQIGYIYEGLLGYTCRRADEVIIGLGGKDGAEPEMPLATLEDLYEEAGGDDKKLGAAIVAWVKEHQPGAEARTASRYAKDAAAGETMSDAEQAIRSVTTDEDLLGRLRDWIGLIRRDLRNRPVVVLEGGLFVVETPSRRNAGAHYTPRDLAKEVVLHALEPIVYAPGPHQTADRDSWKLKSSTEILDLKIADIACGSGAFLVAAAGYLAERLQEAWRAEGRLQDLTATARRTKALRQVVARCLYGADINGMAVEMCKLSLWLVSLDRDLPFSFVDDKVLHGNSLLGLTSLRQLEELHIAPKPKPLGQLGMEFSGNELVVRMDVSHRIQRAISLRQELASEVSTADPMRSAATKRSQLREFDEVTADLRKIADGVIAAGLRLGGKPGKKLDEAYENLRIAVGKAFPADGQAPDASMLDAIIEAGLTPTVVTDYDRWQPLHWFLEVPDVMARGGFDAIIGNPPFVSGLDLGGYVGSNVREAIIQWVASGEKGLADQSAYFTLRSQELLSSGAILGVVASSTLARGDSRRVALEQNIRNGWEIYRAVRDRTWPTATVNVRICILWATNSDLPQDLPRVADGQEVDAIDSTLELKTGTTGLSPSTLAENEDMAFIGVYPNGSGFRIAEPLARSWITTDAKNRDVLFPYITSADLNGTPDHSASMWVIDFGIRTLEAASEYCLPFEHVECTVRMERAKNKDRSRREIWWLFTRRSKALMQQISSLRHFIGMRQSSQIMQPVMLPSGSLIDQTVVAFASDDYGLFGSLEAYSRCGCVIV